MDPLRRLAEGCLLPGFSGTRAPDWVLRRLDGGLGGAVLFARNVSSPEQVAALTAELRGARSDALVCIDEEGGDVTRLEARTGSSYPGNLALGAASDVELTRRVAASMGAELAAAGIGLDLAPVADVNSNPDNPVIGVRSFGADPELVAQHTVAFVAGLQSVGVAACVKHFPGHGDTAVDSHLELPVVNGDPAALEAALTPFRAAIEADVQAVMTAHLVVPTLDAAPATLSRTVLGGLLRQRLGFQGLVVTDALEMAAIRNTVGMTEGAVLALAAGADAICVGGGLAMEKAVGALALALVAAVREGRLAEERLAEAAGRVSVTARWAAARRHAGAGPDRAAGIEAARRALRATGVSAVKEAPVVVELRPEPGIAAGAVPWGLGPVLAERDPSVTVLRCDGPSGAGEVVDAARERPLVLVVRDLHRHPRHAAAADAILARRPDTIVVEMGLPYRRPAGARACLDTHGASRASAVAAAELLLPGRSLPPGGGGGQVAAQVRKAALETLGRLDLGPVALAAAALAPRVRAGGVLHVLGAGHSQLLALEGFYRAGGPAWLVPLLHERLSPARGVRVTAYERSPGLGRELVSGLDPAGALLVVSSSGRNAVPVEAAEAAAAAGLLTIAITSRTPGNRLAARVDHVLDSGVPVGDATVPVGGVRMGPLSTVVGAVLLHALLAETEALLGGGSVLVSNNVDGGDVHNAALIGRYPHLAGSG